MPEPNEITLCEREDCGDPLPIRTEGRVAEYDYWEANDGRRCCSEACQHACDEEHAELREHVRFEPTPIGWFAVHDDYDGPEDHRNAGSGKTREEAINDLAARRRG